MIILFFSPDSPAEHTNPKARIPGLLQEQTGNDALSLVFEVSMVVAVSVLVYELQVDIFYLTKGV